MAAIVGDYVIGIGKAPAIEAVIDDANSFYVIQNDAGRFGLRAHMGPLGQEILSQLIFPSGRHQPEHIADPLLGKVAL